MIVRIKIEQEYQVSADKAERILAIINEAIPPSIPVKPVEFKKPVKTISPLKGRKAVTGTKVCRGCGKEYKPTSNAQVRCNECRGSKNQKPSAKPVPEPDQDAHPAGSGPVSSINVTTSGQGGPYALIEQVNLDAKRKRS